jgi:hypothetical protein
VAVMFLGVCLAKGMLFNCSGFAHICLDVLGYSLHALGLAPVAALFGFKA